MGRSSIIEPPTDVDRVASVGVDSITMENGWSIGCHLPDVQVGDVVEQWGRGIGFRVRGMAVGGRVDWYRTEAEEEVQVDEEMRIAAEQRRAKFDEQRAELDAQFAALPAVFQDRIRQFREAGGEQWRVDFESYELFCSTEAVKIAEWCLANGRTIAGFVAMPYDEQVAAAISDGHSGNTLGMACNLARLWPNREAVLATPGALTPIAGARASGQYPEGDG